MPFDVTSIGEAMLRISVPPGVRLEQAESLDLHPAGAEANVSVALARIGRKVSWISGLPDSALGRRVANPMRAAGVDLSAVHWCKEHRMGTYFVEFGTPPRDIQVIYDRADSCAAHLTPDQINWPHVLDSRLFHITGITPAVSPACLAVTQTGLSQARSAGVPISIDINYRSKLWSPEQARTTLTPMIQGIDLLFCGQGDARTVFGLTGSGKELAQQLVDLSGAKLVVMSQSNQGILAWHEGQWLEEPAVPVEIIDRVGAGDAMAAGIIHGWLDGDIPKGLHYGAMLAAMVLTQYGDMLVTTLGEVDALLATGGGGFSR